MIIVLAGQNQLRWVMWTVPIDEFNHSYHLWAFDRLYMIETHVWLSSSWCNPIKRVGEIGSHQFELNSFDLILTRKQKICIFHRPWMWNAIKWSPVHEALEINRNKIMQMNLNRKNLNISRQRESEKRNSFFHLRALL